MTPSLLQDLVSEETVAEDLLLSPRTTRQLGPQKGLAEWGAREGIWGLREASW